MSNLTFVQRHFAQKRIVGFVDVGFRTVKLKLQVFSQASDQDQTVVEFSWFIYGNPWFCI